MHMCVFVVLTPAALPISLQHPSHTAADGPSGLTGADLLTASIVLLTPVRL